MTRKNWLNLEGEWDFSFDDKLEGFDSNWEKYFPNKCSKILVPYSYHTQKSGIFDTSYHPNMWYRKELNLTKEENQKVLLHFEAIDYESTVYVNGELVGKHTGGYNRFSFDITKYITNGLNTITVYAHDDLSKEKPRGKQRYKKENFECWYIETSGIWKTPWIEYINNSYISKIDYNYNEESCKYNVNTENLEKNDEIYLSFYDGDNCLNTFISKNQKSIEFPLLNNIIKWNEFNPKLYDVEISIIRNNKPIDTVRTYIGFRDIKYNKHISINRMKPYFKMVLDQGYYSNDHLTCKEEAIVKDLLLIKSMGFNAIRKHEKIESQIYNYYCDILGIYTWQEMPSFYEFSEKSKNRFRTEYKEMMNQYTNHPSIVAWVPFNESWGITDIYKNKEQQNFTLDIYKLTKELDSSRPCVTNDGWEHTKTDIVTFHNYQEYGKGLLDTYKDIHKVLNNEKVMKTPYKKAFAEGFRYLDQPLMMTEFAGIAFNDKKGWGYGESVKTKEEFIIRLESLVKAIKEMDFFQGYCITQLTDVQQEINGLLFENREPKISVDKIRKIVLL
jgi:beta-galactosidase/beta-glucuronidase